MSKFTLLFLSSILCSALMAQRISNNDFKILQAKEDSMKLYADKIITGQSMSIRFNNDSLFTRAFVKALKTPWSFNYPFDSLQTISKIYAPDSSFRIFTWQMVVSENLTRQHGAIQMKTADGSLKIFPLIDKSDVTQNIIDTAANNKGWIGAVYYRIIQKRSSNQNYYTLLGYDENNLKSNRKIIEVLSFQNDEPVFGGRFFSYDEDSVFKSSNSRYIMEYKKTAGARLTFDEDLDMIILEHLVSETGETQKKWTYIPDGDYEGFKWKNGRWVHVEKVFNQITELGKEPVPMPVKDAQGNTIQENLKQNFAEEEKPVSGETKQKN
ncbi:MAG TPA: hypothetical protein PLY34_13940 [Ferruginibacter sp.]|nr:hypothetical protein [Ferruginibacter sp.]HPH92280.1 hypothetical protein [Ferruginibacter sp.]